jgi:hypothetical protein
VFQLQASNKLTHISQIQSKKVTQNSVAIGWFLIEWYGIFHMPMTTPIGWLSGIRLSILYSHKKMGFRNAKEICKSVLVVFYANSCQNCYDGDIVFEFVSRFNYS